MNPQKQRRQKQSPNTNPNQSSSSSDLPLKLILSGVGVIAVLFVVQSVFGSVSNLLTSSSKLNLKKVELNPATGWHNEAQSQAPRYGLDDKTVTSEEVSITLRDNGGEDGDYVTLYVNGVAYTQSIFITNAGQSILVPLNRGQNLVQITGDRDGIGGITLAADISTQGNMTSSPIPVGGMAEFYIIRR